MFSVFMLKHECCIVVMNRRLDALRHFVNVLLDDKKWTVLCGFHFLGLEGYVAKQLELKARNTDILGSHVYEAVYSFFVSRKNYKKGNLHLIGHLYRMKNLIYHFPTCYAYSVKNVIFVCWLGFRCSCDV